MFLVEKHSYSYVRVVKFVIFVHGIPKSTDVSKTGLKIGRFWWFRLMVTNNMTELTYE